MSSDDGRLTSPAGGPGGFRQQGADQVGDGGKLPAGHRGNLSVIDFVQAMNRGEFYDPDSADVVVSPEDAQVIKLAAAMAHALAPMLVPTEQHITRNNVGNRLAARRVTLTLPFSTEAGGIAQLFGDDRDRRQVRVSTANASGVLVAFDRYTAQAGTGFLLPANQLLALDYAGQVYVAGPTGTAAAFDVSGLAVYGEVRNVPRLGSLAGDARGEESGAA